MKKLLLTCLIVFSWMFFLVFASTFALDLVSQKSSALAVLGAGIIIVLFVITIFVFHKVGIVLDQVTKEPDPKERKE